MSVVYEIPIPSSWSWLPCRTLIEWSEAMVLLMTVSIWMIIGPDVLESRST